MGDLDIDTLKNGADTNHYLSDLYDTFSSNVNEGNKAVLFFFTKRFHTKKAQKAKKKSDFHSDVFYAHTKYKKHKYVNRRLSLRCFYTHKKYKKQKNHKRYKTSSR